MCLTPETLQHLIVLLTPLDDDQQINDLHPKTLFVS